MLTSEEIQAARLRLQRVAALAVNADEAKMAFDDIDALCKAARQLESEEIEAVNTELMDIVVALPLESARHRAYELIDALCNGGRA